MKRFLVLITLVLALILVIATLFCDVYLLGLLEKSLSQEGKNIAEIHRVQTSLLQGSLELEGFSLTPLDESVPRFQIASLAVQVDLPTLVGKEWVVDSINLHQPVIRMEVDGGKLISRAVQWFEKFGSQTGAMESSTNVLLPEERSMKVNSITMQDVLLIAVVEGKESQILVEKMQMGPLVLQGKKREMLKMLQKQIIDALISEANRQAPTWIRDGLKRNIVDKLKEVIDSDSLKEKSRAIKDKIKSFF